MNKLDKLDRETWLFFMGFMENYDYITGKDYALLDNNINIKEWAEAVSGPLSTLE